jgi:integrase
MTSTDLVPNGFFGDQPIVVVEEPLAGSPFDRAAEWSRAYTQWLAEFTAANTRNAYERAWRDLLEFTGKYPWRVTSPDIRDWIQDLGQRPLDQGVVKGLVRKGRRKDRFGYAPTTIAQYRAAISSFYTFVQTRYTIIEPDGSERALHDGVNPALAVRLPRAAPAEKADYLPPTDLFLLLNAIKQDSVQGLRDYALFLGYVFTGRRNSEWRELQWGDLEFKGKKVTHVWDGKGKKGERNELAPPVWAAIRKYLKAAQRHDLAEDDYIFIPHSDNATRFANVSELTWDRQRPLAPGTVGRLLKKYARRAGLDADRIHIHILRHSAAMLRDASGDDIRAISKMLGHSSLNITMLYLDHLKGVPDKSWRQAAALLKLDLITDQEETT